MPISDFGEVQTLISIQSQISIVLATFGVIITNITVNSKEDSNKEVITELRRLLLALMIIGGLLTSSI